MRNIGMIAGIGFAAACSFACGDETSSEGRPGGVAGERVFFATADTFDGALGTAEAIDELCQARAGQAGLTGTYRAWLPSGGRVAADKIADARYVRTDGVVIARSRADLLDGTIENPLNRDERGEQVGGDVWTGTLSTGAEAPDTCGLWSIGDDSARGLCGSTAFVDGRWTENIVPRCDTGLRLFCFEQ